MREFGAFARLAASETCGLDVFAGSEGGLRQLLLRPGSALCGFARWLEGDRKGPAGQSDAAGVVIFGASVRPTLTRGAFDTAGTPLRPEDAGKPGFLHLLFPFLFRLDGFLKFVEKNRHMNE